MNSLPNANNAAHHFPRARATQVWADHAERVLLVLTQRDIVWNDAATDFDSPRTAALPKEVLAGALRGKTFWVDRRWTRAALVGELDRTNAAFMHAVAMLSASVRDPDIESLIGADYGHHGRTLRFAGNFIISLFPHAFLAEMSAL
jgi:hypothetical protein